MREWLRVNEATRVDIAKADRLDVGSCMCDGKRHSEKQDSALKHNVMQPENTIRGIHYIKLDF